MVLKEKNHSFPVTIELKPNCDLRDLELSEEENENDFSNRLMQPPMFFYFPSLKTLKNLIYKYLDLKKKL